MYVVPMRVRQIVVQREQHHKSEKHPDSAQEVPDVVVVVKPQQRALLIEMSGLRRPLRPRDRLVEEEVHRGDRAHRREEEEYDRGRVHALPVQELHERVEHEVEQRVGHEDHQQEDGEVLLDGVQPEEGQQPVAYVRDY